MAYIGQIPPADAITASDLADNLVTSAKLNYAESTLTDGSSIDWNAETQDVAKVTLAGNITLTAQSSGTTGQLIS